MKRFQVYMRIAGNASNQVVVATRPADEPARPASIAPLNRVSELVLESCVKADTAMELRDDEWVAVAHDASDTEIVTAGKVWSEMEQTGALPSSAEQLSGPAAKIISTASVLAGNADTLRTIEQNRPKLIEDSKELAGVPWAW